jgi:transcriptional regulator with XRE-family HTH domain
MKKPQSVDNLKMGNFLYALRKEKGISQTQLGLLLGVTNKAVSKWGTGENQPEVAMFYQLADFYRGCLRLPRKILRE